MVLFNNVDDCTARGCIVSSISIGSFVIVTLLPIVNLYFDCCCWRFCDWGWKSDDIGIVDDAADTSFFAAYIVRKF